MKLRVARSILSGGLRFIPLKYHTMALFKHQVIDNTKEQARGVVRKHRKMERQNRKDGHQYGKQN